MNDFLIKFFGSLFNEEEPSKINEIVNQLTTPAVKDFTLPVPPLIVHASKGYYLTSTVTKEDNVPLIPLRGIYHTEGRAFWVAKGNNLIKITGTPFFIQRRLPYTLPYIRKNYARHVVERKKLFDMHMSKIANHLDLANVTGLYTEIHAPNSNTEFLKQYTAIPYQ